MTKGTQGPLTGSYSTFTDMRGAHQTEIAAWPPVPLQATSLSVFQVMVQCDPTSVNLCVVGGQHGTWIVLAAGEALTLPINDVSAVYVRGQGGAAIINWVAML